ncbi:iron-siderophore ABC transporter substrate-binding protein [Vibrio ziniensis]|uniref:Iron-siderophore ABC transporter substrate-binding protein n=1 Tax=Vibrio ziniensis TaxID=2711221 RepID=A0A6G7CEM7_9VIBR|nr:iron-siderophore ABC transporter substrate-binding protein [Vibrio ziniensis]QIH40542.1 iron-siderophore ABC transporter substrate-binding protein [Vibrio ziniensis]
MCLKSLKKACQSLVVISSLLLSCQALAEIHIQDSRGEQVFAQSPQRVVVLNWDLLEQVLELEITPVGAPNLPSYTEWVAQPAIPAGVEDIGTRSEPNLDKISALKPDVIIAASPQKDLIPALERIAPVVYLPNFEQLDQSAQVAIEQFRVLAKLLGKEALADQKLADLDSRFQQLSTRLHTAFGEELPSVVAMRFASTTSVFLYGENSTTQYVVDKLGLRTALPQPAAQWGIVQKRLNELQNVKDGYVLYILPFPEQEKLNKSMLWKAMPFVRSGKVNAVRAVWSYGGAMSLLYTAEALTESLLEVAPKS